MLSAAAPSCFERVLASVLAKDWAKTYHFLLDGQLLACRMHIVYRRGSLDNVVDEQGFPTINQNHTVSRRVSILGRDLLALELVVHFGAMHYARSPFEWSEQKLEVAGNTEPLERVCPMVVRDEEGAI